MLKIRNLVKLIGSIGLLALLPVAASAAGDICYLRDASATSPTTAYLLCGQGIVYATTDGGSHWVTEKTGATQDLHAIAFRDNMHGFVVGNAGTILATDDGGKTWQERVNDKKEHFTTEHLLSAFTIGDLAWASGFDGAILHSADGGRTWAKQDSGTTMALQGIYFLDPNHGWAVGWSGTILRTTDGGAKWLSVPSDKATWSLNSVYFRDLQNGWAVGFSGELLASHDGGVTWDTLKSPVQSTLSSVAMDKAGRIWIAADEQLLMSEDGGVTWKADQVDSSMFLSKVFGKGDSLWALGELGMLQQVGTTTTWKRDETLVPAGTFIADSLESMSGAASVPASGGAPAK